MMPPKSSKDFIYKLQRVQKLLVVHFKALESSRWIIVLWDSFESSLVHLEMEKVIRVECAQFLRNEPHNMKIHPELSNFLPCIA